MKGSKKSLSLRFKNNKPAEFQRVFLLSHLDFPIIALDEYLAARGLKPCQRMLLLPPKDSPFMVGLL